jgi:hypothetical protein
LIAAENASRIYLGRREVGVDVNTTSHHESSTRVNDFGFFGFDGVNDFAITDSDVLHFVNAILRVHDEPVSDQQGARLHCSHTGLRILASPTADDTTAYSILVN